VLGVPVPEQVPVPEVIDLVRRVSSLVVRWGQEPERPAALRAVRVRWSLTPVQAANPVWPRRLAQVGHRVLAARLAELQARLPALRDAARAASGNPAGDDGYDALVGRLQRLSSVVVVQPGDATVDEGPWVLDLSGLPASPLLAAFRGAWEALGGQWGEGLPEALGGVGAVSIGVTWPAPAPAGASGA